MMADIVSKAHVICCTCIGAGDRLLENQYFPLVVIDESTQAIEPAVLVPLTKGAQQAIFLGDHYQLPPTVKSDSASELKVSLFSRLIVEGKITPFLLNFQYRMHPFLSLFPSNHFYHNQLKDAVSEEDRPLIKGFQWPNDKPIIMINTVGQEVSTDGKSKHNVKEAKIVVDIVRNILLEKELARSDIGIITPYSGQVRLFQDFFSKEKIFTESTQRDEIEVGEDARTQLAGGLNIASVDGFQGREKQLIIFSTVRSNKRGEVGFLSDWRRLNVALTRAKRGLIVVGNIDCLNKDEHWLSWISWMENQKLIFSDGYFDS